MGCSPGMLGAACRRAGDRRVAGRIAPRAHDCRHSCGDQRRQDSCAAAARACGADHCRVPGGARHHGRHRAGLPQGLAAVSGRGAGHHRHERRARVDDGPFQGAAGNNGGVGHRSGCGLGHDGDGRSIRRGCAACRIHAVSARRDRCRPGLGRRAAMGWRFRRRGARTSCGFPPCPGRTSWRPSPSPE